MNRTYTLKELYLVPLLLILIIAVSEMATAIYTPSLSLAADYFNVSESLAQLTVSINLFALAISGPLYGPWSDSVGRRKTLRCGMFIFSMGSLFSFIAPTLPLLLIARTLQGLGAGVAVVVGLAVVRDLFDETQSAKVLSFMGMAIALSPGLAPVLGGYIAHNYHWKNCFAVVSLAAFLILFLLYTLMPETLQKRHRVPFSWISVGENYIKALKNVGFIGFAALPSLMIGAIWTWMAGSPLLFIKYLNVPLHAYGYYGFSGVLFYVIGTFFNSKLINRFSLKSLLSCGLYMCLVSATLLIILGFMEVKNPIILQIVEFPFAFGLAFIIPNGTALAFSSVRENLGTSSSLLGAFEMGCGAFGVFCVGFFFEGSIMSLAGIMLAFTMLSILILKWTTQNASD